MSLAAQNRQKIHNIFILVFKVSKVIALGANRKPKYDFLLLINSNLLCFWISRFFRWITKN